MAQVITTENLPNAALVTSPIRTLLNNCKIHVFDGPVPATAEEAIGGSNNALFSITVDDAGTAMTWESAVDNGVLIKKSTETWKGTNTSGSSVTPSFYRLCVGSDDGEGVAGGTDYRVQGTVGPDITHSIVLLNPTLADDESITLGTFQIAFPWFAV